MKEQESVEKELFAWENKLKLEADPNFWSKIIKPEEAKEFDIKSLSDEDLMSAFNISRYHDWFGYVLEKIKEELVNRGYTITTHKLCWEDLLTAFKSVPERHKDLIVMCGGDDIIDVFKGFKKYKKKKTQWTVREIIQMMELPEYSELLKERLPIYEEDENAGTQEDSIYGDLGSLVLGPLAVHCSMYSKDEGNPLEDFGDGPDNIEDELEPGDVLIKPYERFIIMCLDGANLVDPENCIRLEIEKDLITNTKTKKETWCRFIKVNNNDTNEKKYKKN